MGTMARSPGLSSITARQWMILLSVQLSSLLFGMTITLANVVLPQIRGALSATYDEIAWVVTLNLVATATRGGKRLIAVVLGASSSTSRAVKAAQLFERGFGTDPLGWLMPSQGTVDSLEPIRLAIG